MIYGILSFIIILLLVKIYLLKKAAREIESSLQDKLDTDTNTLIDISSGDRDMKKLANSLNSQLKELRQERLQYTQGNTELKKAVTNISHDLRTPLTAICGYLDMIKQTDDKEKQERYLSIISDRAEAMKQLTEELFRYSVIISDEEERKTEEVFVNQVLMQSVSSFYPLLSEKGIIPKISITDKRITRNLDKESLVRVFSNLLSNAVKYSDGDLYITMSEGGEVVFENTTHSLTPVQAQQLFDRFYTVNSASNSTGLGLSIAKALLEQMGGSIMAEYNDGRLKIVVRI